MLHKDFNPSVQLENKIPGRDPQGALRQDEMIGDKLTIV
jgi:hypothetical protein